MLTNELIEDNNNYYYVDANGVMVKNTWVAIAADEDETEDVDYRWYYFGPAGKAYKNSKGKTINGKKYGFDDEGKMLFGFADGTASLINDNDDAILRCTYYYGTNDDGARHSGWLRYEDGFSEHDEEYDDDYYWFWFDSNGEKRVDKTKKVNGRTYAFDENGVMITEFTANNGTGTSVEATGSKYYSANLEDGSLKKSAWIRTSMPDNASWRALDGWDDDDHWFRTDSQGVLITNVTKKINSKWYVFDQYGVMQDGLVILDKNKVSGANFVKALNEDDVTAQMIYNEDLSSNGLFYFSADEEKDGAMKTGSSVKISLADDDYKFYFTKTTGQAFDGVKSNKLYRNGILQEASDDKYSVVFGHDNDGNEKLFLVGTTGTVCKAGKSYKDSNDTYWVVKNDGIYNAGTEAKDAKAVLDGTKTVPAENIADYK